MSELSPVWCYWEGPRPPWIRLCLRTIEQHIPGVNLLTPQTWPAWRKDAFGKRLDRQRPNVKSDFIRAHQLYHYGGIWIDADAIVFRDVRPIMHRLRRWDFVAYKVGRPAPQMCSALIASRAGGDVAAAYLSLMERQLRAVGQGKLGRLSLGPRLLPRAAKIAGKPIALIPTKRVHPIHWYKKQRLWEEATDEEHAKYFRGNPEPYCCMLTHRALGAMKQLSAEQLLQTTTLASFLFRKALG